MKNKVRLLLFLTLLTLSLLPLGAAIYLVDSALTSQELIYKNPQLNRVFDNVQSQLKTFSKLNSKEESSYRELFQDIQDIKLIYGDDAFFSKGLRATFSKYFFLGFGLSLLVSLILGLLLSSVISRIYRKSYDALEETRLKTRYLEEIARWQEIAKILAHEMRRPLQPIGTWLSNIRTTYKSQPPDKFELVLNEASMAIEEEVGFLKNMVDDFAKFASLPKPKMQETEMGSFINEFAEQYAEVWKNVSIQVSNNNNKYICSLDSMLFKQALTNLIENAVEANPNQNIKINFSIKAENKCICMEIFNSGKALTQEQRERIFELYFSTKHSTKNMGMGMSIVKFAILEHGGSIESIEEKNGVRFRVKLPMIEGMENAT